MKNFKLYRFNENKLKVLGVIPARLSFRFPNNIKKNYNLTMLEHVYERAKLAKIWIILQLPLVIRKFLLFQKNTTNMTSKNMFVHLIGFMRH